MKFSAAISLVLLLVSFSLQAQIKNAETTGKDYDTHVIRKKETYLSISKKYCTTTDQLFKMNPNLSPNTIVIGERIKVPVVTPEIRKKYRAHEKILKHAILYTAQKKETIYSIAKKNNTDAKTLIFWNDLSEPAVKEGQQLIVGFTKEKYAPRLPASNATADNTNTPKEPPGTANKIYKVEDGAGGWIKNVDDGGNFYALHSTAPTGCMITVKNLMNNKTVTVKVIGKLPATSENEHLIIKLSASAAKSLNILDDKFRVELSYWGKQ